ncbi:MAG: VOC family protein [Deltaproteobacteria bacterium]|nr:VOC family protein [Deltaproteobacteria bacterium]MBW1912627.1 VOC family protein [Deltaproteobacteria bacterium]
MNNLKNQMDATAHHVAISVADLDQALKFYRDLLGFQVDWDMDHRRSEELSKIVGMDGVDVHMVMLKGYGLRVELFKYYKPEGKRREPERQCDFGLTHFALSVKNIHQIYERLLKAGVQFNCPPQNVRPGVWATYMKDPEGVTLELVEYL